MKSLPRQPALWFAALAPVPGLFVLLYLYFTEDSIGAWIFPTGIIALLLTWAGGYRLWQQIRSRR